MHLIDFIRQKIIILCKPEFISRVKDNEYNSSLFLNLVNIIYIPATLFTAVNT